MLARRHVNKLTIKTAERSSANRARILLEDAFRTASFPNLPQNGVVFIKKLRLKKFHCNSSSVQLSRNIDHAILNMSPQLIQWPWLDNENTESVWFEDEYSPYALLLKGIVNKQQPSAWYWKLAVKGWSSELDINAAYDLILTHLVNDHKGWLAIARVVDFIVESSNYNAMLDAITVEQAVKWLSIKQQQSAYQSGYHDIAQTITVDRQYSALKSKANPLAFVSPRWRCVLYEYQSVWQRDDPRMIWLLHIVGQVHQPSSPGLFVTSVLYEFSRSYRALEQSSIVNGEQAIPVEKVDLDKKENNKPVVDEISFIAKENRKQEKITDADPGSEEVIKALQETSRNPETSNVENIVLSSFKSNTEDINKFEKVESKQAFIDDEIPVKKYLSHQFCKYSGLPLMVKVMEYLGMSEFINDNPDLHWIPGALLNELRIHLDISKDDPVCLWLPYSDNLSFYDACKKEGVYFRTPDNWLTLLKRKTVYVDKEMSGLAVLNYWLYAIACYTRLYAGMNIRQIVCRNGKLSITPTHVDLFYTMNQIDINIRMAGIDIDPGWVNWLGKVITIYYEDGLN